MTRSASAAHSTPRSRYCRGSRQFAPLHSDSESDSQEARPSDVNQGSFRRFSGLGSTQLGGTHAVNSPVNPNPQHEPTMEEILASIRKIISEDQPAETAKSGPKLASMKPQSAAEPLKQRVVLPPPEPPPPELDVLDLTEEVPEDVDEEERVEPEQKRETP